MSLKILLNIFMQGSTGSITEDIGYVCIVLDGDVFLSFLLNYQSKNAIKDFVSCRVDFAFILNIVNILCLK